MHSLCIGIESPSPPNVWSWKSMSKIEGGGKEVAGRRSKNSCCDHMNGWTLGDCWVLGLICRHARDLVHKECILIKRCCTWYVISMQMLNLLSLEVPWLPPIHYRCCLSLNTRRGLVPISKPICKFCKCRNWNWRLFKIWTLNLQKMRLYESCK